MLVSFFNFAKKRGYLSENPVTAAVQFREVETPVGVLTPDQTRALLHAASGTPLLPFVAIGAFAGLRRAEIFRLDWSEIDLEENYIEVTAAKSKTASRRVVTIQPNLKAWLLPYAKASGKVVPWCVPIAWQELFDARNRAGIAEWPQNALRHSFASYHLAEFSNAPALALEMGHANTAMIFKHYRKVVKKTAAERYWQIMPPDGSGKVIPFTNPSSEKAAAQHAAH
jgi:integrase